MKASLQSNVGPSKLEKHRLRNGKPLFYSIFILATLLSIFSFESWLWGISAWQSVSRTAGLVAGIAILVILWSNRSVDPFANTRSIQNNSAKAVAIALLSISAFHLLRARQWLWGTRIALSNSLEQSRLLPAEPLGTALHLAIYRFTNAIFLLTPRETIELLSIATGTIFIFVAMRAEEVLFPSKEERNLRRLATAALISNGFAIVFLQGGNTALASLLGGAFLEVSITTIIAGGSIVAATILFVTASLAHISAIGLLPAFIYLLWNRLTSPHRTKAICAITIAIVAWIVFQFSGATLHRSSTTEEVLSHAALASKFAMQRPTVHGKYLLHSLNALLLIGPSSIAAVMLLFTRSAESKNREIRDRDPAVERFLLAATLGCLALVFASGKAIENGLRWDIVACAGPAFALYAIRKLSLRAASIEEAKSSIMALFLLGIFHSLPLVIVGISPSFAGQHVLALPLAPGSGEMIIAQDAEERGYRENARKWYEKSLEKNPANATAERRLGSIAMKDGEYEAAITHFLNAHELDRDNPEYRLELAEALIAQRWFPEAIAQLETLTAAYPESVLFWRRLGFALNHSQRFEEAVAAYEKALELEPRSLTNIANLVSALLNRAASLQDAGRNEEARSLYERAIGLYPDGWQAYNNLAVMELKAGNYDEAQKLLLRALDKNPFIATLHTNLGLVLEKKGKLTEALEHLLQSLELDPMDSGAAPHIRRIEEALRLEQSHQDDSQRKPLNSP